MSLTATSISPIGEGSYSVGYDLNSFRSGECGGFGNTSDRWTIGDPLIPGKRKNPFEIEIETDLEKEQLKSEIAMLRAELEIVKAELEEERQRVSFGEAERAREALEEILK